MVYTKELIDMKKAKIFTNGRSQAVRLPKEFRFSGNEVYVEKVGNIVKLIPTNNPWSSFQEGLDEFDKDLKIERIQPDIQTREDIL